MINDKYTLEAKRLEGIVIRSYQIFTCFALHSVQDQLQL